MCSCVYLTLGEVGGGGGCYKLMHLDKRVQQDKCNDSKMSVSIMKRVLGIEIVVCVLLYKLEQKKCREDKDIYILDFNINHTYIYVYIYSKKFSASDVHHRKKKKTKKKKKKDNV